MILSLYHDLSKVKKWYVNIPADDPVDTDNVTVLYTSEDCDMDEDWEAYEKCFFLPVDKLCNALLEMYEYDFLNAEQCKKLVPWLDKQIRHPNDKRFLPMYKELKDYALKAIEYNTGIGIECC
ncbi:hypothetical protein ACLUWO_05835 [Pseudoscardovia radai]|uniref:hypothetical protein n=1 Tax=Pseudoscardovia radai TaxID=987066 RepID=UPI0039965437